MDLFRQSYDVTSSIQASQARFQQADDYDLRVPDLENIWLQCGHLPKLADYADVGQGFSHIGEDQPEYPAGAATVSHEWFEGAVEGYENLGRGIQTHQLPPLKWLNLSRDVVRRTMSGTKRGVPQVLLNQPPVQRAPWCLRAMMDWIGRPAKTSFTIVRPVSDTVPLEFLWALMNSPYANAFAYAHSSKWNIVTGTLRKLPVPRLAKSTIQRIATAVRKYFDAAIFHEAPFPLRSDDDREEETKVLREFHWRIDAEILRLYNLPVEMERQLLDYFAGWKRVSVPFDQNSYFPEGFDEAISLADFLAITTDWDDTNKRRLDLIKKKSARNLDNGEIKELKELQRLAGLKRELLSSPSLKELGEMETDLRRKGLWRGA